MVDTVVTQRIVPGAPPPTPLSKSQKKKRKSVLKPKVVDSPSSESIIPTTDTKSTLVEKASSEEEEIQKTAIAEEVITQPEQVQEVVPEKPKKTSLAMELLNKRIKFQTKKLSRIAVYSSKSPSELNEDQLKSVSTLPFLQGALRELEESKKALEALEAEHSKELEAQRIEEEIAINERISQEVSKVMQSNQRRLSQILTLLRLSPLLSAADPTTFTLVIDEKERQVIHALAAILLGSETSTKEEVASSLLRGDGEIDNIAYGRLFRLVESYRNPPIEREPTPTPEIHASEASLTSTEQESKDSPTVEPSAPAIGDSMLHSSSGSFHFMQESELEATGFEHGAEWVDKPEGSEMAASTTRAPEIPNMIDTEVSRELNESSQHVDEAPPSAESVGLDWAADDADGLPSINSLHAKFGTSGNVTPEATAAPNTPAPAEPEWNVPADSWGEGGVDSNSAGTSKANDSQVDDDGFVKARGSRGRYSEREFRGGEQRGRGRGSFRGDRGDRGESRGGHRGRGGGGDSFGNGWRGGDGEFRGRGGSRGDRGRGGEFRGRGNRGEHRGRGRGRGGRGGFDGDGEQS